MNTRVPRPVFSVLLACLLLAVAVLTGFGMGAKAGVPHTGQSAKVIEFVICTDDGMRIVKMDEHGQVLDEDAKTGHSAPCCDGQCLGCLMCSSSAGNTPAAVSLHAPASSQPAPVWAAAFAPGQVLMRASQRAPPRTGR
ncbi:hypothetical protein V6L77_06660 [Pannonibacter sp. Pt2-lr]|uniref:DUF2946 domain-containing protein n=1 Tax=Pannonibacter anstelovis TaxID=3121537 RepID=A0ABU7ZNY8_9HYPH